MKKTKRIAILVIAFALLLPYFFLNNEVQAAGEVQTPYYIRVWRGFGRPGLSQEALREGVERNLIPATKALFEQHRGVVRAYLPVIPPFGLPGTVPDGLAIIIYESQKEYQRVRATPEGIAYGDLHWTLFERPGVRTKSGGAVPFQGQVALDTPYDIMGRRVNWQRGHSVFFLGALKPGVTPEKMAEHVIQVRDTFRSKGLRGYIAVFDSNGFEAAWQNWVSKAHAERAWSSPAGQAIGKAVGEMFNPLQWVTANVFRGSIKAG